MMTRFVSLLTILAVILSAARVQADVDRDAAFEKSYKVGKNYYGFCMFCHAKNGKGTAMGDGTTMAPPLAGSKRVLGSKEVVTRIVLHGLTGKVDGKIYEKDGVAMMPPPDLMANDDRIVAGLLTYIRNAWGNEASVVTAEDVKRIREAEAGREKQWTLEELAEKFPSTAGGAGQ